MINKKFVLIPFWVESVLTRNNNSLSDVTNLQKLQSLLSINDLAQLLSLQNAEGISLIKELDSNWYLFNSWRNDTQESSKAELVSVIEPLSCSKDLQVDLLKRLTEEYAPMSFDLNDKSLPRFKLVDLNRDVTAIVLNPGFIDYIYDNNNYFQLISELLKSLYVYNTISEVSNHPLFLTYINLIDKKIK